MPALIFTLIIWVAVALTGPALAYAVVPPVKGLDTAAAIAAVQAAGFQYNVVPEPSCSPPGIVSSTRPPEGTQVSAVPPRVDIVVSKGGVDLATGVTVPNVLRRTFVQAQRSLTALGLSAVDTTRGTEPRGRCPEPVGQPRLIDSVDETKPPAGSFVCAGSKVVVYREIYQQYREPPPGMQCR